jgi:hypothetical protein
MFGLMSDGKVGCRHVKGDKTQIQLEGKTRFSSYAVLIESLQRHHDTLCTVATSLAYAHTAGGAAKKGVWMPPDDDVPFDLQHAERIVEKAETGLYSVRTMPATLAGLKKFAFVYQDITCQRFWDALQVWPVSALVNRYLADCFSGVLTPLADHPHTALLLEYMNPHTPVLDAIVKMS